MIGETVAARKGLGAVERFLSTYCTLTYETTCSALREDWAPYGRLGGLQRPARYARVGVALASMNIASSGRNQMPIDLKISHAERRVTVAAKDEINAADFDRILVAQMQERALSYGKLFDLRGIVVDLSPSDLMAHAGKLAAYATADDIGALALVVDPLTNVDGSVLAALAAAKRPCKMFQDTTKAVEWLRRVDRVVRMAKL